VHNPKLFNANTSESSDQAWPSSSASRELVRIDCCRYNLSFMITQVSEVVWPCGRENRLHAERLLEKKLPTRPCFDLRTVTFDTSEHAIVQVP